MLRQSPSLTIICPKRIEILQARLSLAVDKEHGMAEGEIGLDCARRNVLERAFRLRDLAHLKLGTEPVQDLCPETIVVMEELDNDRKRELGDVGRDRAIDVEF